MSTQNKIISQTTMTSLKARIFENHHAAHQFVKELNRSDNRIFVRASQLPSSSSWRVEFYQYTKEN